MAAVMSMSDETKSVRGGVPEEVKAALQIWGRWRPKTPHGPQAYPKSSPFFKAMVYGRLGVSHCHTPPPEGQTPAVVENMDRIVYGMPPELAAVICMQYRDCFDAIGNEFSPEKKAALCSMSPSTFRNRLEGAHWFVFACMYPPN